MTDADIKRLHELLSLILFKCNSPRETHALATEGLAIIGGKAAMIDLRSHAARVREEVDGLTRALAEHRSLKGGDDAPDFDLLQQYSKDG